MGEQKDKRSGSGTFTDAVATAGVRRTLTRRVTSSYGVMPVVSCYLPILPVEIFFFFFFSRCQNAHDRPGGVVNVSHPHSTYDQRSDQPFMIMGEKSGFVEVP